MNNVRTADKAVNYIEQWSQTRPEPVCAFIYDLQALREHATSRVQSLPEQCRLFYAVKANSDREILEQLADTVHGFEAASLGEIVKIREVSQAVPILFGGPGKTDREIVGAIDNRVSLIHAESVHELQRIQLIAEQRGAVVPVLLRVNLHSTLPEATLAMGGRPTQFGIDEEDVPEAIRLALSLPAIKLEGFHLHSISNNLDARRHAQLVSLYCTRVRQWAEQFGLNVSVLNAGGGIGVNYADLNNQFDWDTFVHELRNVLDEQAWEGLQLIFEPGRYITAACGWYAVQVIDIKRNHGKHYAIVRGGTNHFRLPVSWQHSHPFDIVPLPRWPYPFPRTELADTEVTVVGQLCTPKDVMAKDERVSRLRIGDVILFRYAGAYGWAISHHDFLSHPHPEHVYLME
ncbi:type III PLP-dependent enzyme [Paenibacillus sp. LHD-117]|uniref:type III PLP-dependent enzyme n=1 Tax=Paenibacillus sp. LHD-117 TaxID=3071412 RepID=UPI0027E0B078|nr:type III PLP-dependent enzyme [Paenibacillus sp. LHD-117]MDQ6421978.1 type III PLP-dependent enzyme [Paenibacillus sp. LHD-117]